MTIITIICIMVTLSALVTTSWYRTGKNNELDDRYILTQYHTDGSRKEFEYLKTDIVGRIEKYLHD
ncbi:hypothetical protein [Yersinia phage fPS-19]|uniref:Uncharacterized protein n=4 Tax=Helsettvirus fPS9 TaxID=2733625 RepID=A0A2D0PD12_9CAUD|nr:hypothetical protein [Yersinia phage fPS-19]SOO46436.1 hypothetical protein [Yersinia phage fPS-26]SOO46838.1 hypothetical protein [Yersinia phage fPS-64]